jgi:hypothetical protein
MDDWTNCGEEEGQETPGRTQVSLHNLIITENGIISPYSVCQLSSLLMEITL